MLKKEFTVPKDYEGKRASDFLRSALPDLPESAVRKLFDARDVKLENIRISRDETVSAGQVMTVFLPGQQKVSLSSSLAVVYEDDDILLVNKRPGISVEQDVHGGTTLTDLCSGYILGKSPDAFPPAACHRLDNKTSGLCLFAKNPRALGILQDAFRNRNLDKYYVCLVRGIMKPPQAVCHAWLIKNPKQGTVRITDRPEPDAQPIVTGYETLESGPVSRLRVHLLPGEKKTICFTLRPSLLAFLDQDMRWKIEKGDFDVRIGASSEDIRLEGVFRVVEDAWIDGKNRAMAANVEVLA